MIDINTPSTPAPQPKRALSPKRARAGGQGLMNLIYLVLMILAIRDIRHRSDEELNGKRKLWMLAAFVSPFGPIAYFIYIRRRNAQKEIPLSSADSVPQADVTPI